MRNWHISLRQRARFGGLFVFACFFFFSLSSFSQDYEREKRWSDEILPTLMVGDAVWLEQKNGHRFLGLFVDVQNAKGSVIIAHGRGWSPDFEFYGMLRTKLAEQGYATLAIQLPVLDSTAKLGDYIPVYPDARERFQLAVDFLKAKRYGKIAIVSHSLGATMANQYLINTEERAVGAWVFIGIINGLAEMFRIKIPVLDVFGSRDWSVIVGGSEDRRKQIENNAGSVQVIMPGAQHFFEGREEELVKIVAGFLDKTLAAKP